MGFVSVNSLRKSCNLKILCLFVFVILADILYFKEPLGFLVGVGALFLLAFLSFYNGKANDSLFGKICIYASLGQCFTLIYNPNFLSFSLYFVGIVCLTFLGKGYFPRSAVSWIKATGVFLLWIILNFFNGVNTYTKMSARKKRHKIIGKIEKENKFSEIFSRWTLPISLSVIFMMLFAAGNPIIGRFLSGLEFNISLPDLSIVRILFWIFSGLIFGAFMKPPYINLSHELKEAPPAKTSWLFNKTSILNSLVIFNILFFIQTFSDFVYLWAGAKLPEGMTYAEYAQHGAYPLMLTALLAAIFVLISLRSHNHKEGNSWIKGLIYFWVGQNIFLVISSIFRTELYIEQYSLTYLRLSALIWMGLVAVGLALIIIRIARDKSNIWLINANAIILVVILYICSVLNIGSIVANYNVRHSYEVTGNGVRLDTDYLGEIGTDALPALKWFREQGVVKGFQPGPGVENYLIDMLDSHRKNWRAWTVREYFLFKKLSAN